VGNSSMKSQTGLLVASIFASGVLLGGFANAESVWVSDQFEIMLRTGPSTSNAIELMLGSGTALESLETDTESGYSRVRTAAGTEGWVLTRYLMGEPPAREQLIRLSGQLTNANARGSSMGSQLTSIESEFQAAKRQINKLTSERDRLQKELAEIKRTAANVLAIDSQNKELRQELTDTEIEISVLEEENSVLSAQGNRYWFISGALVLLGGVVLGLILPRMKFQRRSRYDRF
jgi:SH3 domain protein